MKTCHFVKFDGVFGILDYLTQISRLQRNAGVAIRTKKDGYAAAGVAAEVLH